MKIANRPDYPAMDFFNNDGFSSEFDSEITAKAHNSE
jgi:hypothetical protein